MHRPAAVVVAAAVGLLAPGVAPPAAAQVPDRRYVDEPTGGLELPATPLAGDHDPRAVVANPGGLQLLDGAGLVFAATGLDPDATASAGTGLGVYGATRLGGGLLPRLGVGAGFELLRPARSSLTPDPGRPARLSLAASMSIRGFGVGAGWRHLLGDGPAAGVDTFDLGASRRFGNHLALGAVIRDVGAPAYDGGAAQRRYELELVARPLGTDRVDLAFGGRVGEVGGDLDGWARLSARIARGVVVTATGESRALAARDTSPAGVAEVDGRELRIAAGLELSFGRWGAALYGSGRIDERGDGRAVGGTAIVRWAARPTPAVQGHSLRIERVDLSGAIGSRALTDVVVRLRAIARDPAVQALVLTVDGVDAGWATVDELRRELAGVRAGGKRVFVYLVAASTRDYWLATAADRIYLDPAGGVRLTGISATTLYWKGALDRLGAAVQIEKIGAWKSAPEAYTATGPSDAAARMREDIYDSWWATFVAGFAGGRRLDPAVVNALVDGGPYSAGQLEHDQRMIDEVATPERIGALVAQELGGLAPVGRAPVEKDDRWVRPAIAVIYADGDIVGGRSRVLPLVGRRLVGAQSLASALIAARLDPAIGAIVLRIDSPGGSALASEVISREVFATRGVKPIVCSMGDVAASGGYFIAAGCDVIFADPMTVTGSIGIFTGKLDLSGLLAQVGVTTATSRRGARADMESMFRPYTDEERAVVIDRLSYFYRRFTDTVAAGRGLTAARVDELGRGHVWTGSQALPLGLVDRLGGIGDALALARQRMGLAADAPVRLVSLPALPSGLLGLLGALPGVAASSSADAGDLAALADLPAVRAVLSSLPASLLAEPDAVQARLPFDLIWE